MYWQLIIIFLVHLMGDFYALFYSPLLPFLKVKFALTISATTTLTALYLATSNYLQPVFGLLSERFGKRLFVILGILGSAVGMASLSLAPSLPVVVLGLLVGGIGIASFHPCGAAMAGDICRPRASLGLAVYMLGGHFGCLLAPLVVTGMARMGSETHGDTRWVSLLVIPGVFFGLLLLAFSRKAPERTRGGVVSEPLGWRHIISRLWGIHVHVLLRFVPLQAFMSFLPLLGKLRNTSEMAAGASLTAFMVAGALGLVAGEYLLRRFPRKLLMVVTNVGAGVCFLLAPTTEGFWFYATLCAGSFLCYTVMSLQIVIAQELTPGIKSTASSIVMGLAYGNAGLFLIPLGELAEYVEEITKSELLGLTRLLQVSALFFFAAAMLAMFLRVRAEHREAVEVEK